MKRKNRIIEIFRFISSVVIFLFHTDYIGRKLSFGGWIFVDFFLILTGYFTIRHFESATVLRSGMIPEKEALLYTLGKVKRLLPYTVSGILLSAVVFIGSGRVGLANIADFLVELPLHFLMQKICGFTYFDLCAPLWYVSGIVIILPVFILVAVYRRNFVKYIGSWLIPIICYVILYAWHGSVQYWENEWHIHSIIRVTAGLFLGSFVYYLSQQIAVWPFLKRYEKYIPFFTIAGFLVIAEKSFFDDFLATSVSYIFLMVIILCFLLSGRGIEKIDKKAPEWFEYLGRLSVPVYCLHVPILEGVAWLLPVAAFPVKLVVSAAVTLICSALLLMIVDKEA